MMFPVGIGIGMETGGGIERGVDIEMGAFGVSGIKTGTETGGDIDDSGAGGEIAVEETASGFGPSGFGGA